MPGVEEDGEEGGWVLWAVSMSGAGRFQLSATWGVDVEAVGAWPKIPTVQLHASEVTSA